MGSGKSELAGRVDALEARLVTDLDRRIAALSPSERRAYEAWRNARREHHRHLETHPGAAYGAYLVGEQEWPQLSRNIEHKLFGKVAPIVEGDGVDKARERYWVLAEQLR